MLASLPTSHVTAANDFTSLQMGNCDGTSQGAFPARALCVEARRAHGWVLVGVRLLFLGTAPNLHLEIPPLAPPSLSHI